MSELSHGLLLQDQGRLEEAEACFRGVLAREPENDFVHARLALCLLNQEGKMGAALDAIREAKRIAPENSQHHGIESLVLASLRRGREAVAAAENAISLAPDDSFALSVKANAYFSMERWADAEEWAGRSLAADGDNAMAANLMAHALRMQGKAEENQAAVDRLLASDPEDALAHVNAGWSALQRKNHRKAEEHFREALRLDPDLEMAREGLVESFRARSWFYRKYLAYCFFMQRFTGGKQWVIIIGLYLAYQVLRNAAKSISPVVASLLGLAWLALVMWVWLAPGIGNLLILMDRSARLALRPREKWQGIAVGGGLFCGVAALLAAAGWSYSPAYLLGAGLLASTVPASLALDNDSVAGRWVFGAIAGCVYLATAGLFGLEATRHPAPDSIR